MKHVDDFTKIYSAPQNNMVSIEDFSSVFSALQNNMVNDMENEDNFILFWGALYIYEKSSSFTIIIFQMNLNHSRGRLCFINFIFYHYYVKKQLVKQAKIFLGLRMIFLLLSMMIHDF